MADNPTFVEYTGAGAQTDFVFPFSYLSVDHIKVTVAGVTRTFTLPSQNTVRISPAPTGLVRIARVTPGTALVTWNDGAVILGKDLNLSTKQPVNVAEEARDIAAEAKDIAQTAIVGAVEAAAEAVDAAAAAQVSKTAAAASATAAANSQTAAAASATTASSAATTATTKASEAATSATTATTKASEASASASTAATRASEAATSATTANTKAGEASTSAATATTKASEASASATAAATSATSAAATRTLVEGIYDSFDDRYLGLKTTDPTVDNDGAVLTVGAIYFNTTLQSLRLFTTSGWQSAYIPSDGSVASFNNRTGSVVPVAGDYDVAMIGGLQTALDGKAALSHAHTIANVTGLQTALDGKAALTHDHAGQAIVPDTLRYTRAVTLASNTDLNGLLASGFYDGAQLINSPDGSVNWFYILSQRHGNDNGFRSQTAWSLNLAGGHWYRQQLGGVWQPWRRLLDSADIANDVEVRAAAANKILLTSHIETASAFAGMTDAATIAFDWDTAINRFVVMAGNRTLGAPSNNQPGTWRTIWVIGNDATPRTLSFGANLTGNVAPITGITNTQRVLIHVLALDGTFGWVSPPSAKF